MLCRATNGLSVSTCSSRCVWRDLLVFDCEKNGRTDCGSDTLMNETPLFSEIATGIFNSPRTLREYSAASKDKNVNRDKIPTPMASEPKDFSAGQRCFGGTALIAMAQANIQQRCSVFNDPQPIASTINTCSWSMRRMDDSKTTVKRR